MDFPSSPAEQQNLERTAQTEMLRKNMAMQAASAKKLAHLYIPNTNFKNMTRLQARSYPLGTIITIDSTLTDFVTPHTFEDLSEGKHTVKMSYMKENGEVIEKTEEVELIKGKRSVCKIRFLEPKTLADVTGGELGR